MLSNGARVGDWARRQGVTCLHGHGIRWAPLFALAAARAGVPWVATLHNLVPDNLSAPVRWILRAALGRADRLIAVSEAVAAGARAVMGSAGRIVVVRNGIDLTPFAPEIGPSRAEIRSQLGLRADAPVALCVARLSPEKNVADFVRAAGLMSASGRVPGARFLVVGDGTERVPLTALIHKLGGNGFVTLLGARSDVPSLLQAADVVCVPSHEEGLGLVAIEAMAARLPVVATRVGGLPEVVLHGETGLLVPLGDGPAALADALAALLMDPVRARRMGDAGGARAHSCFSASRMVAETRAVYAEVVS